MAKKTKPVIERARSAITGKFVKMTYAKTHPDTTVVETIEFPPRKKKQNPFAKAVRSAKRP